MFPKLRFDIKITGVPKKKVRELNRTAISESLDYIHRTFTPRHFERNSRTMPGGAYGYAPRSRKWIIFKQRTGRGDAPLVFTGRMRELMVNGEPKKTATFRRGSLKFRNYYNMTPERRAEVEAISPQERKEVLKFYRKTALKLMRSPKFKAVRRLRGGAQ